MSVKQVNSYETLKIASASGGSWGRRVGRYAVARYVGVERAGTYFGVDRAGRYGGVDGR